MNTKQRARWERARVKGMWRFVLFYGVVFSIGVIVATSVYNMIISTFDYRSLRIMVPVYLISGFAFSMTIWLLNEYLYRKSSRN